MFCTAIRCRGQASAATMSLCQADQVKVIHMIYHVPKVYCILRLNFICNDLSFLEVFLLHFQKCFCNVVLKFTFSCKNLFFFVENGFDSSETEYAIRLRGVLQWQINEWRIQNSSKGSTCCPSNGSISVESKANCGARLRGISWGTGVQSD